MFKGIFDNVIARVGDQVLLSAGARLRNIEISGFKGMREFWDTAGDLARFLLPLKVDMTQEVALLEDLTGHILRQMVSTTRHALLDTKYNKIRKGGEMMVKERRVQGSVIR